MRLAFGSPTNSATLRGRYFSLKRTGKAKVGVLRCARFSVASIVTYLTLGVRLCQVRRTSGRAVLRSGATYDRLRKRCQGKSARERKIVAGRLPARGNGRGLDTHFRLILPGLSRVLRAHDANSAATPSRDTARLTTKNIPLCRLHCPAESYMPGPSPNFARTFFSSGCFFGHSILGCG